MIIPVFKIALRALARNKARSALTMLGIIIGVASVIAMVSLGQGAQNTETGARLGASVGTALVREDEDFWTDGVVTHVAAAILRMTRPSR